MSSIIFDFDGVLLDSLRALRAAYRRFATAHSIIPSESEFQGLNGPRLNEIAAILKETHGLDEPGEELEREYKELVSEEYQAARLFPKATSVVRSFGAAGFTLAIASSAPAQLIRQKLVEAGIERLFDSVVGGDDIENAKPAPDVYLRACDLLGEQHAIVIEDSDHGVTAARRAGLRVVQICEESDDPLDREHWRVADLEAAGAKVLELANGTKFLPLVASLRNSLTIQGANDTELHTEWLAQNNLAYDSQICATDFKSIQRAVAGRQPLEVGSVRYSMWRAHGGQLDGPIAVAVSGVLRQAGGLLLGRRDSSVNDPGKWDLVPSGSVDWTNGGPDLESNLLRELAEEAGIPRSEITAITPVGAILSRRDRVLDFLFEIETTSMHHSSPTTEYSDFCVVRPTDPSSLPTDLTPAAQSALYQIAYSEILRKAGRVEC